jgi:4'-phosphopantetheinyl transferase
VLQGAVEVRIYPFRLDCPAAELARLAGLLSPDELARAARFRFARDRDRYLAGRGRLRERLGGFVGAHPARLRFRYGPAGRPELADPPGGPRFNLSHAGPAALLAVADQVPVGVDLERHDVVRDRDLLAERVFSAPERAALRSLRERDRDGAFLRGWTRKEAYLKAVGGGLLLDLHAFAVSLRAGEPARLTWAADPATVRRWTLADVSAATPGHIAAVALEAPAVRVTWGTDSDWRERT